MIVVQDEKGKCAVPVPGGPGVLDRSQAAAAEVVKLGLVRCTGPGQAIQVRVDHEKSCKALEARDVDRCTCETVLVVVDVLSAEEVGLVITSGDYDLGGRGNLPDFGTGLPVLQRKRWPPGGVS